jgi:tetratricopeptide (TPR) repeat protein
MPPPPNRYEAAAHFFDRAASASGNDPNILYLLFLAHKRQGNINQARAALRKVQRPDANVLLQLGLLSIQENHLAQAQEELAKAWELDKTSYEICYNLMLTELTLGNLEACLGLIPTAVDLVMKRGGDSPAAQEEKRFLQLLYVLLQAARQDSNAERQRRDDTSPERLRQEQAAAQLSQLSDSDEQRLLKVVRSLGQLDIVHRLLATLSQARPRSTAIREAYVEAALVKAKGYMDRCHWAEAELLLRPLAQDRGISRNNQVTLLNLLGCCACLTQDFNGGINYFGNALKLSPNDPRLHQNLALAYELRGELSQADPHWNRYFDLLDDRVPAPPDRARYPEILAFESLLRLARRYGDKEKWSSALSYMQRAQQLRGDDPDVLEQLFHLYTQAKRPQEARRILEQLRRLRPEEPQYDLYELDLVEVKGLNDIERLLSDIERIRGRHPDDGRVNERAFSMVRNVIPLMGNLCDQLTDQMSKVIDQVRNLPNYQINWSAVREVMRDLLREFQKLRRITGKCLPLVNEEEYKRIVRDLADHIDKKMEACRSMGA